MPREEVSVKQRDRNHAFQFEALELSRMDHAGSNQPDGAAGDEVDEHGQGQGRQDDDQIVASEVAAAAEPPLARSPPAPSGNRTANCSVRDGDIANASVIVESGFAGGRGRVTVYATYHDIEAVRQGRRDYSSCALSNDLTACSGSATQAQGTFADVGLLAPLGLDSFDYKAESHRFVPPDGATSNFAPPTYLRRPARRWTGGPLADLDIRDRAWACTKLVSTDNRSVTQIAPSSAYFVTDS